MRRISINSKFLFYLAYLIVLFSWMFGNVKNISSICNISMQLVNWILLFLFLINIKRITKKEFFISCIILIITLISWRIAQNPTIFVLYLFILNSKDIDLKELISKDYKIKLLFLIIIVLLYYLGCTNNYMMQRDDGTIRSSMGFSHPNMFGLYIFSIYCEYLYINYKKLNTVFLTTISLIIAFIISYFSDSRGSYFSVIFLYSIIIIYRFDLFKIFENKVLKKIINYSIIIATIISILLSVKYTPTNNFYLKLDSLLSGRIRMSNMFLNTYNINLFGNKLQLVGTYAASITGKQAFILDNAYVKLILQYGIIPFIIFIVSYIKTSKKMYNKKDYIFVIIFLTYVIRGMTENILFNLYGNIFLLYLNMAIFKKEVKQNEKIENKKCNI